MIHETFTPPNRRLCILGYTYHSPSIGFRTIADSPPRPRCITVLPLPSSTTSAISLDRGIAPHLKLDWASSRSFCSQSSNSSADKIGVSSTSIGSSSLTGLVSDKHLLELWIRHTFAIIRPTTWSRRVAVTGRCKNQRVGASCHHFASEFSQTEEKW